MRCKVVHTCGFDVVSFIKSNSKKIYLPKPNFMQFLQFELKDYLRIFIDVCAIILSSMGAGLLDMQVLWNTLQKNLAGSHVCIVNQLSEFKVCKSVHHPMQFK